MTIRPKYQRGKTVYLKTDIEQKPRIVTGFVVRDSVLYELSGGTELSAHYDFEIAPTKNVLLNTGSN